ncbi:hypothetical protein FUAX_43770 (plasmid) [Fulvitalea axinellae]|uniref:LamG-like jellyroll fold domain-containing protein n=1 Tax=Fulvitalea axinellae TaxID=1182444 RepID=A0AAU9CRD3_9BACT|nr:hypothetical protein FUAX_43770 [Fulvitalea axinellae]
MRNGLLLILILVWAVSVRAEKLEKPNCNDKNIGECYLLDGIDDFVDIGDIDIADGFSVSFWMKPEIPFDAYKSDILFLNDIFVLSLKHPNRGIDLFCKDGGKEHTLSFPNVAFKENVWQYLTLRYVDDTFSLFLDGELKSELDISLAMPEKSRALLGAFFARGYFKGKMARHKIREGRISDRKIIAEYDSVLVSYALSDGLSFFLGGDIDSWASFIGEKAARELVIPPVGDKPGKFIYDGTNHYYPSTKSIKAGNTGTISFWAIPVHDGSLMTAVNLNNVITIRFEYRSILTASIPDVENFNWTHVSFSRNLPTHIVITYTEHGEITCFLNGERLKALKTGRILSKPATTAVIGNNYWGHIFTGQLYDIGYWTRVLDDAEIQELYSFPDASRELLISNPEPQDFPVYWVGFAVVLICALGFGIGRYAKKFRVGSGTEAPKQEEIIGAMKIRLFGPLEILDRDNGNVADKLTPKLREIFCFLLLRSLQDRPVTTEEFHRTFWPEYDKEKSKNNRNVSVRRIREALKACPDIELHYDKQNLWQINLKKPSICDYERVRVLIRRNGLPALSDISEILARGGFCLDERNRSLQPFRIMLEEWLRMCLDKAKRQKSSMKLEEYRKILGLLLMHDSDFKECETALAKVGQEPEIR